METQYGEYIVQRLDEPISKEMCEKISDALTELFNLYLNNTKRLGNPEVLEPHVIIKPMADITDDDGDNLFTPLVTPDASDVITLGYKFIAEKD